MTIEYLNNKIFESIIDRFKNAQQNMENKEEYTEAKMQLTNAFYTLATNIICAFKFQLVDTDDALQEGVMICFEKLHRFDPKIGKAFNFCTTIILNHYRQLYRTAKNYNEFKQRYHERLCDRSDDPMLNSAKAKQIRALMREKSIEDER